MGQEEREKVISESSEEYDDIIGAEGSDRYDIDENIAETKSSKIPATSVTEKEEEQLYKYEGEKEVNKERLSTLSFNLFLYVADKFKEDN